MEIGLKGTIGLHIAWETSTFVGLCSTHPAEMGQTAVALTLQRAL